jgi:hypothetical protein
MDLFLLVRDLVIMLVGAITTAYITVRFVNHKQFKGEHLDKRVDDLCEEIRQTAELGSEYWLVSEDAARPIAATRIQTRVTLLEGLRHLAGRDAPELLDTEVSVQAGRYLRTLTGGDFGVHNRVPDIERAREIQRAASAYIREVRRARLGAINERN